MSKIKIGNKVRCLMTGLTGIASQHVRLLAGTTQWAVQPQMKEGDKEVPGAVNIDEQSLEFIDDGIHDRAHPEDPSVTIQLGNKVRDLITGDEGFATVRTTFVNGCVYFDVIGTVKNKDGQNLIHFLDHKRLKFLHKGQAVSIGDSPVKSTGGPMSVSRRQS